LRISNVIANPQKLFSIFAFDRVVMFRVVMFAFARVVEIFPLKLISLVSVHEKQLRRERFQTRYSIFL